MDTNPAGVGQPPRRQQPRYDPNTGGHYGEYFPFLNSLVQMEGLSGPLTDLLPPLWREKHADLCHVSQVHVQRYELSNLSICSITLQTNRQ